jgi:rieske iron-sulfur protein
MLCRSLPRRGMLRLGSAVLVTPPGLLSSAANASASPPGAGDPLVFEVGGRSGAPIDPDHLEPGGPPVLARALRPEGRPADYRSSFDQVLLVRLDPARLSAAEAPLAADGVVGFSAICTHASCVVSGWKPAEGHLFCPCHGSVYDPAAGGQVVAGPAPRPLPALPLRVANGALTAAGGFTARIGGSTGRTD